MVVIAAYVTKDTAELMSQILAMPELVQFTQKNTLHLSDKTVLHRLALINLIKHLPDSDEIIQYKPALLRPNEFDNFLRQKLGVVENAT